MNGHTKIVYTIKNDMTSTKLSTFHISCHLILTSMLGKAGRAEEGVGYKDFHSVAEGNYKPKD